MKRVMIIAAACMLAMSVFPLSKSYGEGTKRYEPVKVTGWVAAIPCERHLPEGEACVEIYLAPKATIDVFEVSRYDDRELEYRRVDTVRIPDEKTHEGQQDRFELSLDPGRYVFVVHNGKNGQTSTLGPIDIFIGSEEAELTFTMYNHAGDRPPYDMLAPREICMKYKVVTRPSEPKLIPETFCSTIEPPVLP